ARTYDGAVIGGTAVVNPYTLVVPASGKAELRLSDLFGSGISQQHGWLEIDPSTPDVKAFSFVYDAPLSFVEGVDFSAGASNQIGLCRNSRHSGISSDEEWLLGSFRQSKWLCQPVYINQHFRFRTSGNDHGRKHGRNWQRHTDVTASPTDRRNRRGCVWIFRIVTHQWRSALRNTNGHTRC